MQTEKQIREGQKDCREKIEETIALLCKALANNDDDKIAEHCMELGMFGGIYLTVNEILKP